MNNLDRLWSYSKNYWKILVLSVVSASIYGIVAAIPTWLIKHTVDDVFIKNHRHLLIPFLLLFLLFFVLKGIFMYITSYSMNWVGNKVINDIRKDLFEKIIRFPLSFFQKNNTGKLMSHFLNDVQMIQSASSSAIKNGVRSFFEAFFLISFAFIQNWKLASLLLIVGPIMAKTIKHMGKIIKKASLSIQSDMGSISSLLQEVFIGIREIKAFSTEAIEVERLDTRLKKCFRSIMTNVHVDSLLPVLIEVIAMFGGGIVFYLATQQVMDGSITAGQLTSFIAAVILAYQPMKRLVSSYSEIQYGLAASERIFGIMDKTFHTTQNQSITLKAFNKTITFTNVSFSYDNTRVILNDVNITIRKGESIGIVGPSGSGKSTLCDLLLGFVMATSGKIFIDGIDISTISGSSLRKHIGYVGQRMFLFNDTIERNVAYGSSDSSEKDVFTACKAAHAHEFIQEMADNYQTNVGENGNCLSGGQKQRITIARALLKDPEILIFDEVTSSLDQESERMIQLTMKELAKTKTLFIISHRPNLLKYVDRILLVKDGKVSEIAKDNINIQNKVNLHSFPF